jgi:AraC-like DNA-binding protein
MSVPFGGFGSELTFLAARPLIRAASRDQMEAGLRAAYNVGRVHFGVSEAPFVGIANRVHVGGVGLHYCRYDTPVHIEFPEMAGYRQLICLSGSGTVTVQGRRISVDEHTSCIIPPDTRFTVDYGDCYSQIVLQFDPAMLRRKAELVAVDSSLRFPEVEPLAMARLWRLKSIALTLAHQFSEDINEENIAIVELAQSLASTFLCENLTRPQSGSRPLLGPSRLRNAALFEDYIDAHWNEPLTVEDIAAAGGVSVRSVFARFKERRNTTPMAYLRGVRLAQAHRLLLEGGETTSVIDVAMKCGFSSFGHFAKRYKDQYGELPSTTLSRRPPRPGF